MGWASIAAFGWIAAEREMRQLCGYHVLARLFGQKKVPAERDAKEFLDQAASIVHQRTTMVARAAVKALVKFMDLGPEQEKMAENVLS